MAQKKKKNSDTKNEQGGRRIMATLNGDVNNVNGGNNMMNQVNQNQNQVEQQVMQQATVAGQQTQVKAVPITFASPNINAQAQYVIPQQGQVVDPNIFAAQQITPQQLSNPNPATQAQQVMQQATVAGTGQPVQPKVVYVQVPAQAAQQTQEPQIIEAEQESSFIDEHPWLTLGLAAAAGYVGYKFISNTFFDDDNSNNNDTIDLTPSADFSSFF